MSDRYAYWRRALALAGDGGKLTKAQVSEIGPITSEPECGFWRLPVVDRVDGKRVKKSSFPVAIFESGGAVTALVDGRVSDPAVIWSWCATTPISEQTYRAVAERREWWPEGTDK